MTVTHFNVRVPDDFTRYSIFELPGLRQWVRDAILGTGGRLDWITDRATLEGRNSEALVAADRIHSFTDGKRQMSSPYGWRGRTEDGFIPSPGEEITVAVHDFSGRHLVETTFRTEGRTLVVWDAHLSPDQADLPGELDLETLLRMVADPHLVLERPAESLTAHRGPFALVVTTADTARVFGPYHSAQGAESAGETDEIVVEAVASGATIQVVPIERPKRH
jgi:hypothetical protein